MPLMPRPSQKSALNEYLLKQKEYLKKHKKGREAAGEISSIKYGTVLTPVPTCFLAEFLIEVCKH